MRQKISPFGRDSVLDRISNRKFQQISALQSQKSHTRTPTEIYNTKVRFFAQMTNQDLPAIPLFGFFMQFKYLCDVIGYGHPSSRGGCPLKRERSAILRQTGCCDFRPDSLTSSH